MEILSILTVALIVFEGFIIQSDAVSKNIETSPLPDELAGRILFEGGLNATKGAGYSKALIGASQDGMGRIFQDRILVINYWMTLNRSQKTSERFDVKDGQIYFHFGSYARLMSLFGTFGKDARRIFINYRNMDESIRRDINKNIINKYAEYLTELRMYTYNDAGLWEEISNGTGAIHFPNVKRFTYVCDTANSSRRSFDMNAIFPKLENFKLIGSINDPNCLENVTNLKELTLRTPSIQEDKFPDIFAKNQQITKLNISPQKIGTLKSIEKHLKSLQTLKIQNAAREFLIRDNSNPVYNLISVTYLVVIVEETNVLYGSYSFNMPKLKRLILKGGYIDEEITQFINHFENLESVEVKPEEYYFDVAECIEKLIHVKEFKTPYFCSQFAFLESFLETSDKTTTKLDTLKLICMDDLKEGYYEAILDGINEVRIESNKPIWTMSYEDQEGINYMMLTRNS